MWGELFRGKCLGVNGPGRKEGILIVHGRNLMVGQLSGGCLSWGEFEANCPTGKVRRIIIFGGNLIV